MNHLELLKKYMALVYEWNMTDELHMIGAEQTDTKFTQPEIEQLHAIAQELGHD